MKQTIMLCSIAILLLSGCASNTSTSVNTNTPLQNIQKQPQTNNTVKSDITETAETKKSELAVKLETLLKKQFDSSSKAVIKTILTDNNKIAIQIIGVDELGPIAVDVALVLNRNSDINFASVDLTNDKGKATFNKDLFNNYRTGIINDVQFMNSL